MKKLLPTAILAILIFAGAFRCPLYAYIGIPCPSCGMTRAWRLALSGDFSGAFSMHPLFAAVPLIFLPRFRTVRAVICALLLLFAVYLLRMIILFPHTPPMNYNYDSFLGGFLK